ncbi:F0F1 ATP synthase subunit delta [Paenibacillus aurantius]|uniref:ATP synthase subunit delta n=1 Tax=Paenibacillus aurantius TaxID=2918900 RepID=A0AA96LHI7_9BACL|nr:F0F1 ATP synthase subunit delta [Paenibacillus aurantius]WNQ11552.1 F0F1 ATP synthase subunit delta [Paenibacillus aurantius]
MSQDTIVAKRYAKALFEVARGRNQIAQVEEELAAVVSSIRENADFRRLLEHPNLDASVKTNLLTGIYEGKVSEAVFNTLRLLVDRGRESLLPYLLNDYVKIANEELGQAKAIVTTPLPLTAEETEHIAAQFGQLTGKTIRVENVIDSSLLGGLQVRIGDRLYDGSLSGKLNRLQKTLAGSQAL